MLIFYPIHLADLFILSFIYFSKDHHKFISVPQERVAKILGRCSSFLNSDEATLVLESDKISSLNDEVQHLEKDRQILLSTVQDRLKYLSQTKDELVQFCQV